MRSDRDVPSISTVASLSTHAFCSRHKHHKSPCSLGGTGMNSSEQGTLTCTQTHSEQSAFTRTPTHKRKKQELWHAQANTPRGVLTQSSSWEVPVGKATFRNILPNLHCFWLHRSLGGEKMGMRKKPLFVCARVFVCVNVQDLYLSEVFVDIYTPASMKKKYHWCILYSTSSYSVQVKYDSMVLTVSFIHHWTHNTATRKHTHFFFCTSVLL